MCRVKQWLKPSIIRILSPVFRELHWYAATVRTKNKGGIYIHTTVITHTALLFYYYLSKRNEMKKTNTSQKRKKEPVEHRLALKGN